MNAEPTEQQTAEPKDIGMASHLTSAPAPDTRLLPVDPETGQPIAPRAQPGYYPGFSTLAQQRFWDEATRQVVVRRVRHVPPLRFFTPDEARLAGAICDRVLPQDDRDAAHRIPILAHIDERLFENRIEGYRYEDMPPDQEAYRLALVGIEAVAHALYGRLFVELEPLEQDNVLLTLHDDDPPAGRDVWERVPPRRFWPMLVHDCIAAYYAHPWAWDEIGFGGPAYPRGYMRLERGAPEPWEVQERRYLWEPPAHSLSGVDRPMGGASGGGGTHPGQIGTH